MLRYPEAVDRVFADAVYQVAIRQFALWQAARRSQGVRLGELTIPEVSHPDIQKEWSELPVEVRQSIVLLTHFRIFFFRDHSTGNKLVRHVNGKEELTEELREGVAHEFHIQWIAMRQLLGLTITKPHVGDKAWEEENAAERANDMVLVDHWVKLLGEIRKVEEKGENSGDRLLKKFLGL